MGIEELRSKYGNELVDYIQDELRKGLLEELAKQPWWCMLCGMGGNYEGDRPDEYWFPPDDHVCQETKFTGFTTYKDIPTGDLRPLNKRCPLLGHECSHEECIQINTCQLPKTV